jgi:LacI family transcriptional regulator
MKSTTRTLQTISRELDMSIATVSKALNDYPDVSEAIRLKVKAHAQAVGFTPRRKVTRVPNIALCLSWEDNFEFGLPGYITQVEEGMAAYLWSSGLELSIYGGHLSRLNDEDITRELSKRKIDGVVVVRGSKRAKFLDRLIEHQFPNICVFSNGGRDNCSLLAVDNELVGFIGTQHLVRLGHQRIGVMVQSPNDTPSKKRLEGYARALKEVGLSVAKDNVVNAPAEEMDSYVFGYESAKKMLSRRIPPTALFCLNHEAAVGAMHYACTHGVRIPEDLSIIACDDFPISAYLAPPLTTVKIPNRQIGKDAAAYVHRCISDKTFRTIEHRIVSPEFIVRQSTGPVNPQRAAARGKK